MIDSKKILTTLLVLSTACTIHASDSNKFDNKVTIFKKCKDDSAKSWDEIGYTDQHINEKAGQKCINHTSGESKDLKTFTNKIRQRLNQADARIKRALKSVDPEFLETILDMAGDADKAHPKNSLRTVEPSEITFLCDLALNVYYDKETSLNPNNISFEYLDKKTDYEGELSKINVGISQIDTFITDLKKALTNNPDLLKVLEEKQEELKTEASNNNPETTFKKSDSGSSQKIKNVRGGLSSKEKKNIKIVDLHSQALRSFIQRFKRTFNDKSFANKEVKDITVDDLMNALMSIKGNLLKRQTRIKAKLETFSDPFLKEYWAKLKKVLVKEAAGFEPIDVFYRNLKPYVEPWKFLKNVSRSRHNEEIDDVQTAAGIYAKKQFSGVLLFKDGSKNGSNEDELVLVFSGSNSEEDWRHNLIIFKKHGESDEGLGLGLRMHTGIHDALNDSLKEFGTKLAYWIDDYKASVKGSKRKLKVTTTGHSLGGALALLAGYHLKHAIAPALSSAADVNVKVINFAAPPIFNKTSAEAVEKELGRENIIRVWTVGDPVTHFSIIHKTDRNFKQSPLAFILNFHHVGRSIPLFDDRGLRTGFKKLSPWLNHLSSWYANLVHLHEGRWNEHSQRVLGKFEREVKSSKFGSYQKVEDELKKVMAFLRNDKAALMTINFPLKSMEDILDDTTKKIDSTLDTSRRTQSRLDKEGKGEQVTLAKTQETSLSYKHELQGRDPILVTVTHSTTCSANNLLKQAKMSNLQLSDEEKSELSCGCCWTKNLFVSYDNTLMSRFRRNIKGKKINSLEAIEKHCEKNCGKELMQKLFPNSEQLYRNVIKFMENMTTTDNKTLADKLKTRQTRVKTIPNR